MAGDDLPASPTFEQDSVALHFTWRSEPAAVAAACTLIETTLDRFGPRPHWGKVFTTPARRLGELHPALGRFRAEAQRLDPDGVFRNDFVRDTVWAAGSA